VVAVCPARGEGGVPKSTGCDHVIVSAHRKHHTIPIRIADWQSDTQSEPTDIQQMQVVDRSVLSAAAKHHNFGFAVQQYHIRCVACARRRNGPAHSRL
jgi:hypothetical protein